MTYIHTNYFRAELEAGFNDNILSSLPVFLKVLNFNEALSTSPECPPEANTIPAAAKNGQEQLVVAESTAGNGHSVGHLQSHSSEGYKLTTTKRSPQAQNCPHRPNCQHCHQQLRAQRKKINKSAQLQLPNVRPEQMSEKCKNDVLKIIARDLNLDPSDVHYASDSENDNTLIQQEVVEEEELPNVDFDLDFANTNNVAS